MSRSRQLATVLLAAVVATTLFQWATWPEVAELEHHNPKSSAFIEAFRKGQRDADRPDDVDQRWVAYDSISDRLKQAVLVAEDIDFFSHEGFAVDEIKTALQETLREGKPLRGASTLSQQLVKNLWLSPSRNPWRKVKEAMLTRQLEARLSKHRILELYLNVVEFGPGIYGAEAAAQRFFGRRAGRLSRRQAAALAAGLPSSAWYPGAESRRYRERIERTLRRMEKARWIDDLL